MKERSKRWKIVLVVVAMTLLVGGGWAWQEGRPWYNGIQAYLYGYPLVVMDVMREVSTAVPTAGGLSAPVNQFAVMTKYPDVTFRLIPRTGLDTQFAVAWADLGAEPLVLSVPDTGGRYYVIALFDLWSNVFASIGSRTTGTDSTHFLITAPGWKGVAPPGVKQTYESPTRFIWVNGQMQSNGPQDYEVVNALQKQYKLTPLSAWGRPYTPPTEVPFDPDIDSKALPLEQVSRMDASVFFGRVARLMKNNPPAAADAPMLKGLKQLGIEPGVDFDIGSVNGSAARGLNRAMTWAPKLLQKGIKKLKTEDGWIVIPANFADYGTDYLTRAGIALIGLGGILPQDILYPTAFKDVEDKPLDSANRYVLHFDPGQTPPGKVTWSVAMYGPEGFYVPNSINRYHLAAWMPLKYNGDGSLDIYIQAESPGPDKESNWLPAPVRGPFNLTTRIFWPSEAALAGTWRMPGIRRVP